MKAGSQKFGGRRLLIANTVWCMSCAVRGISPPPSLAIRDVITNMRGHTTAVERFTADLDVTYMGPAGRRHGTVTVAVQKPSSICYQVIGPHGGLLEAFATNGLEMQIYGAGDGCYRYGPATPANLDAVLGRVPLHYSARRWVELFFGEVEVPPHAAARWDAARQTIVVEWHEDRLMHSLDIDPQSYRPTRGQVLAEGTVISDVKIERRENHGLPHLLIIAVPAEHLNVVARLDNVDFDPALDAAVFSLVPPPGAAVERLGDPRR